MQTLTLNLTDEQVADLVKKWQQELDEVKQKNQTIRTEAHVLLRELETREQNLLQILHQVNAPAVNGAAVKTEREVQAAPEPALEKPKRKHASGYKQKHKDLGPAIATILEKQTKHIISKDICRKLAKAYGAKRVTDGKVKKMMGSVTAQLNQWWRAGKVDRLKIEGHGKDKMAFGYLLTPKGQGKLF
jgi:hypothetical protein